MIVATDAVAAAGAVAAERAFPNPSMREPRQMKPTVLTMRMRNPSRIVPSRQ
jgi:hypothetical protein